MHSRSRAIAFDSLAAIAVLVLGLLMAVAGAVLNERASSGSFDALLGLASSIAGLAIVGVWLVTMSLAIASALLSAGGRHGSANWVGAAAPAFMRRLAFAVLGASLVAGPVAHAAPEDFDPSWRPPPVAAAIPVPIGPTPGLTAADAQRQAGAMAGSEPGASAPVGSAPVAGAPVGSAPMNSAPVESAPVESVPGQSAPLDARYLDADQVPGPISPARAAVDPGWTPSKTLVPDTAPAQGPLVRAELRPERSGRGAVEVRLGDTLWSIAARHLGAGATVSDIADAWPRWFEANRAAIGTDPDLIRPGLLLVPPDG